MHKLRYTLFIGITATALAMSATPASAFGFGSGHENTDLRYTYIEGDYVRARGGLDGAGIRGGLDLGGGLYGFGSYARLNDAGFRARPWEAGLGYRHGLADNVDVLAEMAYSRVNADHDHARGYRAAVGGRAVLADRLEGLVKINYYSGHDFNARFSGTVGAQYRLASDWSVVGEVEMAKGGDRVGLLGVRASF